MPISIVLTPHRSSIRCVQNAFIRPELDNLPVTTTSHLISIADVKGDIFDCCTLAIQKKTNQKTGTNSSLLVETKHTLTATYIHDEQPLEPFYPTFMNLTETSPKECGLLRIYSLLITRCHRSTTYTLSSTSSTSEGEKNLNNISWITDGSPLQVRFWTVDNLLAVIL